MAKSLPYFTILLFILQECSKFAFCRSHRDLFEEHLKTYDKREKPKGIVSVEMDMHVLSFDNLDESSMKFSMNFYFAQWWKDERFQMNSTNTTGHRTINMVGDAVDQFWLPDTVFVNAKDSSYHSITVNNRYLSINLTTGYTLYHSRISSTASCRMDLRNYPLDEQQCYLAIESYGHDRFDLTYAWYKENGVNIYVYDTEMANFDVTKAVKSDVKTKYHTPRFSGVTARFVFERRRQYFFMQVYLPCLFVVMVTWVSFWIDLKAVPARSGICVTSILTLMTMLGITNANMPKVSYVKALDLYLFTSFLFVFSALVEYILVLRWNYSTIPPPQYQLVNIRRAKRKTGFHEENTRCRKCRPDELYYQDNSYDDGQVTSSDYATVQQNDSTSYKKESRIDQISRFLFPIVFLTFNIVYWAQYMQTEIAEHIS